MSDMHDMPDLPGLPDMGGAMDIVPDNIRAVGALHVSAMLDAIKAYDVADKLVALFATGALPITQPATSHRLFEFWRDASERLTTAERRDFYARTLGIRGGLPGGDANDSDSHANREFAALWMRFIAAVAAFAPREAPHGADGPSPSTPAPNPHASAEIRERVTRVAAHALASNVSRHGEGLALVALAINEQRQALIDLLSDREIQSAYGVRGVWQLVERVATLELGGARPTVRYKTMAARGAVIFAWLASRSAAFWSGEGVTLDAATIAARRRGEAPTEVPTDYDLVDACEHWLAVSLADPQT